MLRPYLPVAITMIALGGCAKPDPDHHHLPPAPPPPRADIVAAPANMANSADQMILTADGQLRLRRTTE